MWLKHRLPLFQGPVYVFASHAHFDHFNEEIFSWRSIREDIRYLLSKDIIAEKQCDLLNVIILEKEGVFKDEFLSVKAFGSTDQGVSFYVEADGKHFFHAGDLNNWHWKDESTKEEITEAESFFYKELNAISMDVKGVDVLMFPLDPRLGSDYADGALEFVKCIKTGVFIPMHCQGQYNVVNQVAPSIEKFSCRYMQITHPQETFSF